ncbi:glycoside hydrolase family 2 protein [Acidomyces richmondensis BFW]|nr:MAG: glycoside hydrolase family 2 protein [Acidomyces sp. 'richmondensis']KYG50679.1 glycoside hydrolase family 2 protein [Acidomyces richmondensis BFW]
MRTALPLLAANLSLLSEAQRIINLSGRDWTLTGSDGNVSSVPAQVPSQQYLDLQAAGVVGNTLYGDNDVNQIWVEKSNWTYMSGSLSTLKSGNASQTYLVFEGLDTFASISFCNESIGTTNNQFRQYIFDITSILSSCEGEPRLAIDFGSASTITQTLGHQANITGNNAQDNIAGPGNWAATCSPDSLYSCRIWARKEQNDFGWDWSPSLAPAGPWLPIYAIQLNDQNPTYINNALVDIYRQGQMPNLSPDQGKPWVFNVSLDCTGTIPYGAGLRLTLKDATTHKTVLQTNLENVNSSIETITGSTIVNQSSVDLWWPVGMGDQKLYSASIDIVHDGNCIASVERRVGFRTIVLNLSRISAEQVAQGLLPGANWNFEVNGHVFYAKGSNFVPPSPFWPSVNQTHMQQLFNLVTEGNQNMLRVWSSGAYLPDWIYHMADEMGILLWSEFEFSDAVYPNTSEYLANYEAEAYYQVRRVNYHPSLALWAGGNELETMILGGYPDGNSTFFLEQYRQIQEELLIKCVYANSHSISYIPSSTYNGYLSLNFSSVEPQLPRYDNKSSPEALYLDSDYYNYDASIAFNLSTYPIGRFADEFGFISMPSLPSWQDVAPPADLYMESPTVIHHNRHFGSDLPANATIAEQSLAGIEQMTTAVKMWYPTPNLSDSVANFSAWIYSTQVFQASFYQHQIAVYRRGSGLPNRQLGSLYWQLEDLWVAPTWASIESNNRQKILYYTAKDIYSPVIVYAYYNISNYDLQVWVTSDLWEAVRGTVEYEWIDWSGKKLSVLSNGTSGSTSAAFTVGPINSTQVLNWPSAKEILRSGGLNTSDAILRVNISATGEERHQQYTHEYYFHPAALNEVPLQDPNLLLTHTGCSGCVDFTVTAQDAVAAWVWLEIPTNAVLGYWSDNGFWMNKGESRTVRFKVWKDWTAGKWVDTVTVRSMWNNTLS